MRDGLQAGSLLFSVQLLALAALVCTGAAIGLTVWIRRMRPKQVGSSQPIPALNVLAIGTKEAGKTTFLASMFDYFRVGWEAGGPRLRLQNYEQRNYLTRIWARVNGDSADNWPDATRLDEVELFSFECVGSVHGVDWPVLSFNYVDYAGEAFDGGEDADDPMRAQRTIARGLERHVKAAHAIFGIIDGHRVAQHLKGHAAGTYYLRHRILPMVDSMHEVSCPIYLVVTKWDILAPDQRDDAARLKEVRDALLAVDSIGKLIEQCRRRRQIVRLIPVSAVGREFGTWSPEAERLERRPDGRLQPLNVEYPLCAVVPDLFAQVDARLAEGQKAQIGDESAKLRAVRTPRRATTSMIRFLRGPSGSALRAAFDAVLGFNVFSERLAEMFLDWLDQEQSNRHRAQGHAGLARTKVVRDLSRKLDWLNNQYPSMVTGTDQ